MRKTECLAMILAGGQGSRLGALTKKIAKPAVPFGGKYRIIDFPLSNCANSGIGKVGVLTQYKPLELHNYLGTGSAWDLDRKGGGVFILPPYAREKGADWYRGTADAIYQNLNFIDLTDPEYVLILSGDHIYTMDYSWMLESHKMNKADATIGVFEVPWDEAPRFGIMNTDKTGRIEEFEEKPPKPKSNLASMGIYIFNWKDLRKLLISDMKDPDSDHDFGKNIIPTMLADNKKLIAYRFEGYWKDVGTIDSLWEANMDLLDKKNELDLSDPTWRIYSEDASSLPAYIGPEATIDRVYLTQGTTVEGYVKNSVLSTLSTVKAGAKVIDTVLMPYAKVEEGAVVTRAIVASGVKIGKGAVVGSADSENIILVSKNVKGVD